ncbi:uncharacterized protein LOC142585966 isoform X1 [Dermacentor variabilis]|uniref:uncharacterized protein LOC142585966 isoform X1 n=1 Tax=Dermacentor variabilis TaxID=34621 RepID=UPI003F5BAD84
MEYAVDGEEISPEEYEDRSLWIQAAIKAHDRARPKHGDANAQQDAAMTPTDATGKAAQTSGVNASIRRRPYKKKPLPRLPESDYKIVHRPRGGLRLRDHTATTLLYALCLDIGVNFGEIMQATRPNAARTDGDHSELRPVFDCSTP